MEKYPNKRGYAVGKLQKFLKKYDLTKDFKYECLWKGNRTITGAFDFTNSDKGPKFWSEINHRFERYKRGELDD